MTNSAISTEHPGAARGEATAVRDSVPERLVVPATVAAGWLLIFLVYRWHLMPSAVFLAFAWASLVLTAKVLWSSFFSVATEAERSELTAMELGQTRRGDLLREKRALLRAIKDAEFDRDMGKMSDDEAAQIIRVYRARAIEVIREIEVGPTEASELAPAELIERELATRLGEPVPAVASAARVRPASAGDAQAASVSAPVATESTAAEPTAADAAPASAAAAAAPAAEGVAASSAAAAATEATSTCGECGTRNDPDAVFCKKCGTRTAEAQ